MYENENTIAWKPKLFTSYRRWMKTKKNQTCLAWNWPYKQNISIEKKMWFSKINLAVYSRVIKSPNSLGIHKTLRQTWCIWGWLNRRCMSFDCMEEGILHWECDLRFRHVQLRMRQWTMQCQETTRFFPSPCIKRLPADWALSLLARKSLKLAIPVQRPIPKQQISENNIKTHKR